MVFLKVLSLHLLDLFKRVSLLLSTECLSLQSFNLHLKVMLGIHQVFILLFLQLYQLVILLLLLAQLFLALLHLSHSHLQSVQLFIH